MVYSIHLLLEKGEIYAVTGRSGVSKFDYKLAHWANVLDQLLSRNHILRGMGGISYIQMRNYIINPVIVPNVICVITNGKIC